MALIGAKNGVIVSGPNGFPANCDCCDPPFDPTPTQPYGDFTRYPTFASPKTQTWAENSAGTSTSMSAKNNSAWTTTQIGSTPSVYPYSLSYPDQHTHHMIWYQMRASATLPSSVEFLYQLTDWVYAYNQDVTGNTTAVGTVTKGNSYVFGEQYPTGELTTSGLAVSVTGSLPYASNKNQTYFYYLHKSGQSGALVKFVGTNENGDTIDAQLYLRSDGIMEWRRSINTVVTTDVFNNIQPLLDNKWYSMSVETGITSSGKVRLYDSCNWYAVGTNVPVTELTMTTNTSRFLAGCTVTFGSGVGGQWGGLYNTSLTLQPRRSLTQQTGSDKPLRLSPGFMGYVDNPEHHARIAKNDPSTGLVLDSAYELKYYYCPDESNDIDSRNVGSTDVAGMLANTWTLITTHNNKIRQFGDEDYSNGTIVSTGQDYQLRAEAEHGFDIECGSPAASQYCYAVRIEGTTDADTIGKTSTLKAQDNDYRLAAGAWSVIREVPDEWKW